MPNGAVNSPGPHSGPNIGAGRESARRAEFESLYEHHSREVWALAYARWMDSDLAMDVTQEAFLRLWKHWEAEKAEKAEKASGEEIQNPRAWLLRVARNLAEDYAKSSFRRNGTQPPEVLNGVRSKQPLPIEKLEREEQFGQLRAILAELSPADRDVLTLRYALDYDTNAIAEMMGVNVAAIHMRLSRARQRVAERFTEQEKTKLGSE
ncbi:MAG TPA: sigma-70 family RNA polymerase sigma factor [Urbifossiella sp.]